jgi:hypothetical protein
VTSDNNELGTPSGRKQHTNREILCPKGDYVKLELLPGTPNMFRNIQCPTCKTEMVVIATEIRSAVRLDGNPGKGTS